MKAKNSVKGDRRNRDPKPTTVGVAIQSGVKAGVRHPGGANFLMGDGSVKSL